MFEFLGEDIFILKLYTNTRKLFIAIVDILFSWLLSVSMFRLFVIDVNSTNNFSNAEKYCMIDVSTIAILVLCKCIGIIEMFRFFPSITVCKLITSM